MFLILNGVQIELRHGYIQLSVRKQGRLLVRGGPECIIMVIFDGQVAIFHRSRLDKILEFPLLSRFRHQIGRQSGLLDPLDLIGIPQGVDALPEVIFSHGHTGNHHSAGA